jgi:hypothetical protein
MGPVASGVLSVLYARMGDRDKAYDYFVKSYLKQTAFGVSLSQQIATTLILQLEQG